MKIKQIRMLKALNKLDSSGAPSDSQKYASLDEDNSPCVNNTKFNRLSQNREFSQAPIISVTGTSSKTIVTQMIAHTLIKAGNSVATAIDNNLSNDESTQNGIANNLHCAPSVDSNRQIAKVIVLETSRSEILQKGLSYNWSDVSIITSLQPDYNEQFANTSITDALQIKSLIAERVREGGTLILNADDELLVRHTGETCISNVQKNIVYFSLKSNHILLKRHILAGGTFYTIKNGWLVEICQTEEIRIIEVAEIPVTLNGKAEFNIANALAAAAACRAHNLSTEEIAAALRSYREIQDNNGLNNFYEVDGAYIFFEHSHNHETFKAVCQMAANLENGERRVSAVIGISGDHSINSIAQVGYVAAQSFDRITIREDEDLRGRKSGEIAQLLYQTIREAAPDCECRIILSEDQALRREITRLREDDILICFYENPELVQEILKKCEAIPATKIKKSSFLSNFNLREA
jgi:cyanophycin synthetase